MKFFHKVYDVDIYMKSGNVIHLRDMRNFKVDYQWATITGIHWISGAHNKPLNINLEQVEAIVQVRFRFTLSD